MCLIASWIPDRRLSLDRPQARSHTLTMRRSIETASLFILIAVTVLRPLVAESYDSATSALTSALDAVGDPSPIHTYVFDFLILAAAAGWLFARAVGRPRPYRPTGLGWGLVLVGIAATVSCVFAGQKRLAVNGAIDWLCYPILTIALVQLMVRPWHRRLLVAAVLASALTQAAICLEQHFAGFDDTWAHYQSIKEDFWTKQGVELDSNQVEAFEGRMKAREASGNFPHSNVAGSYLVLCAMAAAGLLISRWRQPNKLAGWLALVAAAGGVLLIVLAAISTKSVGALGAAIVGAILWVILHLTRTLIDARRKKVFILGWCCVAAGMLAVVAYGLYKDRPGRWSLTYEWQSSIMFRWQYWRASAGMIADRPLIGVGRENFGRHYLQHKSIQSPEEIANPHNLFVQAATDWGVFGLLGIAVMLVGGSYVVTKCRLGPGTPRSPPDTGRKPAWITPWAVALTLVVVVGRLPLLGTDDFNYRYYTSVTTGVVWLLGFAVFAYRWVLPEPSDDAGRGMLGAGVAIGLLSFLLSDMINFAMFVPGAATTLFALLAVRIVEVTDDRALTEQRKRFKWRLPLGALGAAIVVIAYVGLVPLVRSARHLTYACESSRHVLPAPVTSQLAYHQFEDAADADPVDPTPYVEQAEWLMGAASVPELREPALEAAASSIARAIKRDPYSLKLRRMQTRVYQEKAKTTGDSADLERAVDAARAALELYPLDPKGLVALADCQAEAGRATDSKELLQQAVANYKRALNVDDERLAWEKLRRLPPKDREAIRSRIDQVQALLQKQP